jgi:hypothetical protein
VNGEADESVLQRLTKNQLAARVRGRGVRVVDDAAAWPAAVFASSTRRPLTVPLLVAALLLLAAETAVTRAGGGAGRGPAASGARARAAA